MRMLMLESRVVDGQEFLAGRIYYLPKKLEKQILAEGAGRDADAPPPPEPEPPAQAEAPAEGSET